MKKKILGIIVMFTVIITAGLISQQNNNESDFSNLFLENIEALASGESGSKNGKALAQKSNGDYCCAKLTNNNCTSSPDC